MLLHLLQESEPRAQVGPGGEGMGAGRGTFTVESQINIVFLNSVKRVADLKGFSLPTYFWDGGSTR